MKLLILQSDPFVKVGVMSISAVLKKAGHQCDVLIESGEKDLLKAAEAWKPDVVGFSSVGGIHEWDMRMAKKAKERLKVPIIFGGPYPTFYPEIIEKDFIDIVCLGEGEEAVVELLDRMEKGGDVTDIQNLWVKKNGKIFKNSVRNLIEDLDSLPFPDRSIYYKYDFLREQDSKEFVFIRGCPFQCSFCFEKSFRELYRGKGRFVRKPSVKRVLEEIRYVKNNWGTESVMIYDDLFIVDPVWVKEFAEGYGKEFGMPFFCEVRADTITEEVVRDLKGAGCKAVYLGIESGNEFLRNEILKKGLKGETIEKACNIIKSNGLMLKTYNMVGIPGETLKDALQTMELNIKVKSDYAWCSVLRLYPRTELADYAIKNGWLKPDFGLEDFGQSYMLSDTPLQLKDKREILNLQRFFALGVEFPFLVPLIRLLVRLPPNPAYDAVLQGTYAYLTLKTSRIGVSNFLKLALRAKRTVLTRRQESAP